eukprot:749924-Hanusia_phi.AAC.1
MTFEYGITRTPEKPEDHPIAACDCDSVSQLRSWGLSARSVPGPARAARPGPARLQVQYGGTVV